MSFSGKDQINPMVKPMKINDHWKTELIFHRRKDVWFICQPKMQQFKPKRSEDQKNEKNLLLTWILLDQTQKKTWEKLNKHLDNDDYHSSFIFDDTQIVKWIEMIIIMIKWANKQTKQPNAKNKHLKSIIKQTNKRKKFCFE